MGRAPSRSIVFILVSVILSVAASFSSYITNIGLAHIPGDIFIRLAALTGPAIIGGNLAIEAFVYAAVLGLSILLTTPFMAKTGFWAPLVSPNQFRAGAAASTIYVAVALGVLALSSVKVLGRSSTSLTSDVSLPIVVALSAISAFITAAVEEYIFRERMLSIARVLRWGPIGSSVTTSALFAIAHSGVSLDGRLCLFLMGLALAFVFLRGGGWAMATGLHFSQDFIAILANPDQLRFVRFFSPLPWTNAWTISAYPGLKLAALLLVACLMMVTAEVASWALRVGTAEPSADL